MKNRFTSLCSLGILALTLSTTAFASKDVTVSIDGMDCGSCAKKVEKQVNALKAKGVESCKIDLGAKTAQVKLSDQSTVTADELKAAVKKAGYEAKSVTGI